MTDILMAGNAPNPDGVASAVRKEQQWRCDFCRVKLFATLQEASAHEEECRTQKEQTKPETAFFQPKKKTKKRGVEAASNDAVTVVATIQTKRSKQWKTATSNPAKKNEVIDLLDSAEKDKTAKRRQSSAEVILIDDQPAIAATKVKKKKEAPINPFFGSMSTAERKKIMEEQAAVEFQAKRRLQRERDRKMREERAPTQPRAEISTFSTKPAAKPSRSKGKPAPSFPVPSHVCEAYSVALTQPSHQWMTDAQLKRFPTDRVEASCGNVSPSHQDAFFPLVDSSEVAQETLDSGQERLLAIVSPPPTVSQTSLLWSDKYSIHSTEDVCGSKRREVAKELVSFVEEWMVERQKSVRRAAQRQKALLKVRAKKKIKRKTTYEEDDLFSDEDETKLNSVCLLTGPSGSGKTQLIHAIAKHCECEILEISTAERRGAAALRKAIEEATQSHSSLDMLKKNQASFFGKTELVDSDDEAENDKASLTIILLDEVDNLFEMNGDNGFWSALGDLTKRSKCPVFLTANSVPAGVASCYYTVYEIPPPTPTDCAGRMHHILKQEGFSFRKPEEETCKALEDIASVYNCDLRRITLELQVMARGSSKVERIVEEPKEPSPPPMLAFEGPVVEHIRPAAVHFDQYSLVTITGKHFLSVAGPASCTYGYPVDVSIGSQTCLEGYIMDDTTILAVCAPWQDLEKSKRKTWTSNYAPVSIHGRERLGRLSTSSGRISQTELPNGKLYVSVGSPCNLEVHFEVPGRRAAEDEEEEFDSGDTVKPTTETSPVKDEDHEQATKLLQEGVEAWLSTHGSFASSKQAKRVPTDEAPLLEACRVAQLESDAALFEEGLIGLPYLSGACPGYGYDLTGMGKSNENSKPPSEERLFAEGWKESTLFFGTADTYMTAPMCPREVRLLRKSEATLRGWSIPTGEIVETDDADGKEKESSFTYRGLDEDAWLPNPAPVALSSLPTYLRAAPDDSLELKLKECARRHKVEQMSAWLRDYLLATTLVQARLNARGLTRIATDPLIPLAMSDSLVLDYLPTLRNMAVWEAAHEVVDKQTATAVVSKRTTRRSRQVRKHYFESVSPAFEWEHANEQQTSSQMGQLLADAYLRY